MQRNSSRDWRSCAFCCAALVLSVLLTNALRAEPVIFHLKGGDRIAGTVLSEGTNSVVIATPWVEELSIPLGQIESRQTLPAAATTNAAVAATQDKPAATKVAAGAEKSSAVAAAKPNPVKEWRLDAKLGMDLIYGEKDRRIYYGQVALKYARPYESNPRQFFRNTLEYRVDYATTDEIESANRMYGSDKMDFDVGDCLFIYNFAGAGFDEVRKIDMQYEVGPGLGYHLFRWPTFTANVEGGFSYQSQDRHASPRIDAVYARAAQDLTWKIYPQTVFSQRAALLTRVDSPEQMQLRLEANLALAIVRNVSFNLTAIEMYDTRPVPGVTPNEFQLRSAIGLAF